VSTEIRQIAETLTQAHAAGLKPGFAALGQYWADEVEVVHEPPSPTDGTKVRDELRRLNAIEADALAGALSGGRFDYTYSVDGNTITLSGPLVGTLSDGTPFRHDQQLALVIEHGAIVKAVARYDPAGAAPLMSALEAAFGSSFPQAAPPTS
jgi:hypothetical protein